MTVWVLFVWMGASQPYPMSSYYETKVACQRDAQPYKRAVCVKVEVPSK